MAAASRIPIDIVLPVHNEAASIEATLREYRDVTQAETNAETNADVRFVVSEDGSRDGSPELLKKLRWPSPPGCTLATR